MIGHMRANVELEAPCRSGRESVNGSNGVADIEDNWDNEEIGKNPGAV